MQPQDLAILIGLNAALSLFWYVRGHAAGFAKADTPEHHHRITSALIRGNVVRPTESRHGRLLQAVLDIENASTEADKMAAVSRARKYRDQLHRIDEEV